MMINSQITKCTHDDPHSALTRASTRTRVSLTTHAGASSFTTHIVRTRVTLMRANHMNLNCREQNPHNDSHGAGTDAY